MSDGGASTERATSRWMGGVRPLGGMRRDGSDEVGAIARMPRRASGRMLVVLDWFSTDGG